jgi:hypothetical protein
MLQRASVSNRSAREHASGGECATGKCSSEIESIDVALTQRIANFAENGLSRRSFVAGRSLTAQVEENAIRRVPSPSPVGPPENQNDYGATKPTLA